MSAVARCTGLTATEQGRILVKPETGAAGMEIPPIYLGVEQRGRLQAKQE